MSRPHRFFLHTRLRHDATGVLPGTQTLADTLISPYAHLVDCHDYEEFRYELADGTGTYQPLAIDRLQLVRGLLLYVDKLCDVRLYSQIDSQIRLTEDSVLVLWDCWIRTQTQPVVQIATTADSTLVWGIAIGESLEEPL